MSMYVHGCIITFSNFNQQIYKNNRKNYSFYSNIDSLDKRLVDIFSVYAKFQSLLCTLTLVLMSDILYPPQSFCS